MSTDLETYEGQVARLDLEYVRATGEELRARLSEERPAGIAERLERTGMRHEDAQVIEGVLAPPNGMRVPLPVGVAYEPSNGTRYDLIFTPVRVVQQVVFDKPVPVGVFDEHQNSREGWVMVAKCSGTDRWAYPFDLSFGERAHCDYVAEQTNMGLADAAAITVLFRAVCGVELSP